MPQQKLKPLTTILVLAATLSCAVIGFVGYNSYRHKQVNAIIAHRAWQMNREIGIPLSMEADADATPEERRQARIAALEQLHWHGQSEIAPTPLPGP